MQDLKKQIRKLAKDNHLSQEQEEKLYLNINKIVDDYLSNNKDISDKPSKNDRK